MGNCLRKEEVVITTNDDMDRSMRIVLSPKPSRPKKSLSNDDVNLSRVGGS